VAVKGAEEPRCGLVSVCDQYFYVGNFVVCQLKQDAQEVFGDEIDRKTAGELIEEHERHLPDQIALVALELQERLEEGGDCPIGPEDLNEQPELLVDLFANRVDGVSEPGADEREDFTRKVSEAEDFGKRVNELDNCNFDPPVYLPDDFQERR
jgi:hypothetical protein